MAFEGSRWAEEVAPLLSRLGLAALDRQENGRFTRVAVRYSTPQRGAEIALELAASPLVHQISASREVLEASGAATPPAGYDAGPSDGSLRGLARALSLRILQQGDARSPSVRAAAADLLAAASAPEDVALGRDWIRFDTTLTARWPEVAAAALILARHGSRAEDEARLIRALGWLNFGGHGGDLYKPAKRRVVESLAKLLATDNPARIRELRQRLGEEKAKPAFQEYGNYGSRSHLDEGEFDRHRNELLVEALYLALTKYAGADGRAELLDAWEQRRVPQLFAYLNRVDPASMRALYERWRGRARLDGADHLLVLYAVAEHGTRDDVRRFYDAAEISGTLDNQTIPMAAEAAARLVERTGAWDLVAADADTALRERMGDSGNFPRMLTAVHVAGAAGTAQQLARLEAIMRTDPSSSSSVNFVHEMTQHDAASAWARLALRLGRADAATLQAMLVDVNPIVNEAAMEALALMLKKNAPAPTPASSPAPASSATPASPAAPASPFFKDGAPDFPPAGGWSTYYFPDDAELGAARPELSRLSADQRRDAAAWARRFGRILTELLGVPFTPEVRYASTPDGGLTLAWVLRQSASGAVPAAGLANLKLLVNALLRLPSLPQSARQAQLRRYAELGYDDAPGLAALMGRLSGSLAEAMGLLHDPTLEHVPGRGQTELWLQFHAGPDAPERGFQHPHRTIFDHDRHPDGFL